MKTGIFLVTLLSLVIGSGARANDAIGLRDGLLVDLGAGTVYCMQPTGGIEALELASGELLWRSAAADRPISLDQGVLLSQIDTALAGQMDLASLDAESGQLRSNQTLTLEKEVMPIIDDHLGTRFELRRFGPDESQVAWKYESRTVRGMPSATPPPVNRVAGAFSVAAGASKVSPMVAPDAGQIEAIWHQPSLRADNAIAGASGQQYRSANNAHVLVAKHDPKDGHWNAWVWEIYGADGSRVGGTRTFTGFSPFLVMDGTLLFVTQPFTRRLDDGSYESQPLMLRAVVLSSGEEVWAREIRDTRYYGPYPV